MSKYPKITQKDLVSEAPTKKVLETIGNTYGRLLVTSVAGKRVLSSTFYVNCIDAKKNKTDAVYISSSKCR